MQHGRQGRNPARHSTFSRFAGFPSTLVLVLTLLAAALAVFPLAAQAQEAAEQIDQAAGQAPKAPKDEPPAAQPAKTKQAKPAKESSAKAPPSEAQAAETAGNADGKAAKDQNAPEPSSKEASKEAPKRETPPAQADKGHDAPEKDADKGAKAQPQAGAKDAAKDVPKDGEPRKDSNKDAIHPQQAQPAPAAQAEQEEEDQTWKIVQQRYGEELAGLAASAQALTDGLDGRLKAARQLAVEMERRYERIKAQQGLADDNPWEMRFVVRSAQRLERESRQAFAPHLDQAAELARVEQKLGELETEFKEQIKDNAVPEMANVLNGFLLDAQKIRGRLKGLSRRLAIGLTPVRDAAERIAKQRARLEEGLPAVWRSFFFEPASSFFNPQSWKLAVEEGGRWRQGVTQQTLSFSRIEWSEMRAALLKTLVYSLLLGGAAFWGTRLLARRRPYLVDWSRVRRSALVLALAAGTLLAVTTAQSDRLGLLAAVGQILAAGGLASAAWLARSRLLPEEIRGLAASPLTPLWALFSLGLLLEVMAAPGQTLAPFWCAALLAACWLLARRARHPSASLEKAQNIMSRVFLVILAGLTALGWGHLAVLAAAVWFLACLALTIGVSVSSLLKTWHLENDGAAQLAEGLLHGLGFPAIVLGLASLILGWLAAHLGGEVFLDQIAALQIGWGEVSLNVFKLTLVFTLYFVTRSAAYVTGSVLRQLPGRWPSFDRGAADSLQTVSAYALWAAFALAAMYLLGVNLASLAVIAGGLSVGIGFGMQNIVNNFISGLILLFGRAIQTGDVIQLGDMQGVVKKIQIRNAIVQTGDNATIFVPNSDLLTSKLVNWSHKDPRVRREIMVGVAYGASTDLVARLLLEAAREQPHVLHSPSPDIIFKDFAASSLVFVLRFWVEHVNKALTTTSEVRYSVERKFRDNGIEIAYPK